MSASHISFTYNFLLKEESISEISTSCSNSMSQVKNYEYKQCYIAYTLEYAIETHERITFLSTTVTYGQVRL